MSTTGVYGTNIGSNVSIDDVDIFHIMKQEIVKTH